MVKFKAVVDGKIVAEGRTMAEALKNAEAAGHDRLNIKFRSVREKPKV